MARRIKAKSAEPTISLEDFDIEIPEVSMKNNKKELLAACEALAAKLAQREPGEPPAKVQAERKRKAAVVEQARAATVKSIVTSINALKIDLSEALNDVMRRLVGEAEKLSGLEEALSIETERLAELHDIEVVADTLALLLQRQQEAERDFEARIEAKRTEVKETLEAARSEAEEQISTALASFEAEQAERRAAWQKEQAEHEQAVKERDARVEKERKREEEEYDYNLKQQRKKDEDGYKTRRAEAERELAEQKEAQERVLGEREAKLTARETKLVDLEVAVESFPQKLEEAVAVARETAAKDAEREARSAGELKERSHIGEKELLSFKIKTLEAKVKEQEQRIEALSGQLDTATGKVQEIAVRAIEGAAGKQALSAVNEIALEQAKKLKN